MKSSFQEIPTHYKSEDSQKSKNRTFIKNIPRHEQELRPYDEVEPLQQYLNEIGKTPLLTREEEIELSKIVRKNNHQSQEARNKMMQANLRLVVKIAHEYRNYGIPLLDLISEGNLGLIKAVERFDPEKGGKLSTYGAWWIKQSIKMAIANNSKAIRLPLHLVDKIAQMKRVSTRLNDELGREATNEEIGNVMDIPANKIAHYKTVSIYPASLDSVVGEDGTSTLGDFIGDENTLDPFQSLNAESTSKDIREILDKLDPREAKIIRLRFGLNGNPPMTLEKLGLEFNITRERIRQLQTLAMKKIRCMMEDIGRQRSQEQIEEERYHSKKINNDLFPKKVFPSIYKT